MSHVVTIETQVNDLSALRAACTALGLEFVEGQTSYRYYGRVVGDYPLPEGFTVADIGKCQHAIRVKGNAKAYEIGVVRRRDGKSGYQLIYDFWGQGMGLEAVAGKNLTKLRQEYSAQVVIRTMGGKHKITREVQADGRLRLRITG